MDEILETSFSNACHREKIVVPQFQQQLYKHMFRYSIGAVRKKKQKTPQKTISVQYKAMCLVGEWKLHECGLISYAPQGLQIFRRARSCVLTVFKFDLSVLYIIDIACIGL